MHEHGPEYNIGVACAAYFNPVSVDWASIVQPAIARMEAAWGDCDVRCAVYPYFDPKISDEPPTREVNVRLTALNASGLARLAIGDKDQYSITAHIQDAEPLYTNQLWRIHVIQSHWFPEDPHMLFMYVNGYLMLRHGATRFIEVLREVLWRSESTGQCFQGIIDSDIGENISYGTYYDIPRGTRIFRYELERLDWDTLGSEKKRYVRGPFWGNYLGPELAVRANPEGGLLEAYKQSAIDDDEPGCVAEQSPAGGMLLCATRNPLDCVISLLESHHPVIKRTIWLRRHLRELGLTM